MRTNLAFVENTKNDGLIKVLVLTRDNGKKEYWAVDTTKNFLAYIPYGDDEECEQLREEFMEDDEGCIK